MSAPAVSIHVLNFNGLEHLAACLPSVAAQEYPVDRFEVVVVDNGSTDGSLDFVRQHHPGVRIVAFDTNRGFAAAYNTAVRGCASEFVAFLNNDTRVAPSWLSELVSAAQRHHATAVASKIVDWSGERIDFAGGVVSFVGHSWQRHQGDPASVELREEPLLFACGASMLVARPAFLEAGGFDDDFFAYFEDVDLGWRLSLFGYRTVLAPQALTFHRLHGTAARWPVASRLRLYERNALAMIYKNYEADTLERVLPAAVALSLARGLRPFDLDSRTFHLDASAPGPTACRVPPSLVAHLIALEDFGRRLPTLDLKRADIQRRRVRSDADLCPLFGEPFRLHEYGTPYERLARSLIDDLQIEPLFRPASRPVPESVRDYRAAIDIRPADRVSPPALLAGADEIQPTVSVVILTALGAAHLPPCLASLREQTYPPACREVIVVDNGSPEDPTPLVSQHYPGARVIRNDANLGFTAGNNIGARSATGRYVVFLNDDTRAHPDWLAELVTVARRRRAASVASLILDWDGRRVDFAGGSINLEGKGFQLDHGRPLSPSSVDERPLLFACGAAMLVERSRFLELGGWDDEMFAYYEDVELGWRLWLSGHEVWLAPRAIVYHRHHGTSARTPTARHRFYERNSLRILYTHLDRRLLNRVLPAALLLAADRALLASGLSRAADPTEDDDDAWSHQGLPNRLRRALQPSAVAERARRALGRRGARRALTIAANTRALGLGGLFGASVEIARETLRAGRGRTGPRPAYLLERGGPQAGPDPSGELVSADAAAVLMGVREFLEALPTLSTRRRAIQSWRRRSDDEILKRFATAWLSRTPSAHQREHDALHASLVGALHLDAPAAADSERGPNRSEVQD